MPRIKTKILKIYFNILLCNLNLLHNQFLDSIRWLVYMSKLNLSKHLIVKLK